MAIEKTDLSVIMSSYNHQETIAEAIESVMMQSTDYSIRLHVLNDASTDKTGEIIADYASKYPDLIKAYESPKNLGSGKASFYYHKPIINTEYWTLLAGDDYWTSKDKVQKQLTILESDKSLMGCCCNTLMKNEMTSETSVISPSINEWSLNDMIIHHGKKRFYVHPSGIVWRNIYSNQGSFLPPRFKQPHAYGDVMLFHAMLAYGKKLVNIPETMSCYRVTGRGVWSSLTKSRQSEINAELMKLIPSMWPFKYKILNKVVTMQRAVFG